MRRLIIAACLILLPAGGIWARPVPTADLENIVQKTYAAWNVPGATVVIVKDGKTIFAKGYGVRSLASQRPVDLQTSFYLASVTKTFTSAAIQMLADERKLDVDQPAAKYLREFAASSNPRLHEVTVRDLLTHRTGFPRTDLLMFGNYSNSAILQRLGQVKPMAANRERFTYQNQMYLALSELGNRTSGSSWTNFVESRILKPLGMTSSNARGLGSFGIGQFRRPARIYRRQDGSTLVRA